MIASIIVGAAVLGVALKAYHDAFESVVVHQPAHEAEDEADDRVRVVYHVEGSAHHAHFDTENNADDFLARVESGAIVPR